MPDLIAAVEAVSMDEWALALRETVDKAPDGSWHRMQRIWVVRDDAIAEYLEDLGPEPGWEQASAFAEIGFRIPAFVPLGNGRIEALHTVGELRDIAWWRREHPMEPVPASTNIMLEWAKQKDEAKRLRRGTSSFGLNGKLVRNYGYNS